MQPVIVEAVNAEVVGVIRGGQKAVFTNLEERFKKALRTNAISLADESRVKDWYGAQARAIFAQMNSEGHRLYGLIDRGEAFSHAAANTLSAPIATNDFSAVHKLREEGESFAVEPILGFWDLMVFAHQVGLCTENECDDVRQQLVRAKESLPVELRNTSFQTGLQKYFCKLADRDCPIAGSAQREVGRSQRLFVSRTASLSLMG